MQGAYDRQILRRVVAVREALLLDGWPYTSNSWRLPLAE
jgi:hypothetical protein